ncbi:MarR family transcriptional regulator [Clostridium sp. chh4-2]|uniref:MarR family winged helix-turn-helix transcriptional regulator n=1 Tax=Clostridium sp. chh4-2 TaxID=2067550 RepID=UPI000CCE7A46|nr:MarR family transcriptional regulator [Clostridium sp. chh4-2]PNV60543.1 MarR family transcriptional regulator [Clostridium sp. chh4-2]
MNFTEMMLKLLPYWYYKIEKPFKMSLKDKMSLETYYCLQILQQDGSMTMTDLAARLKISKQQATKIIDTLNQHHFIERKYNERDRRYIRICVSDSAIQYIEENIYKNTDFPLQLEEKIGKEDVKRLEDAMATLLEILPKLD